MKRRWWTVPAAVLAIGLQASADAGPLLDAMRARRERAQPPAGEDESVAAFAPTGADRGRVTLPPGGRLERDLAYGDDPAQRVDVYIPEGAKGAPIVLMVHGGAWMMGDKGNSGVVANKVAHWLPKGYIVASPNYRMSRAPNPLDQADDVGRALAFVQSNASTWGGDSARVLLMGHSSGAHLVALLGADPTIAVHQGAKPWLGVVALDSAALNVVETMSRKHARFYDIVFGSDPAHWSRSSPFDRLTTAPKPMLMVCSSRRSDSCPAARAFVDKVASLGGRAAVLPVDLTHGEINAKLGQANDYSASVEAFMRSLGLP